MFERREYFRISTIARIGLRRLPAEEVEIAKRRVLARHVPAVPGAGTAEETGLSAERKLELDLLHRIASTLERIDRRLDDVLQAGSRPTASCESREPCEITLSGSGFKGAFDLGFEPGDAVEVDLDLLESGLPRIAAIAIAVAPDDAAAHERAFRFEVLHPEDQERIVRMTLRSQSQALQEERSQTLSEERAGE